MKSVAYGEAGTMSKVAIIDTITVNIVPMRG